MNVCTNHGDQCSCTVVYTTKTCPACKERDDLDVIISEQKKELEEKDRVIDDLRESFEVING